ncbi:hypothetical protein LZ30DRAFT_464840 [Colletotrichum cereale]|nr:hypothetical protein LZ30DRAFT_464840 [Colletotrichum cereale]
MVCFVWATYHLHVLSMGLGLSAFTWLRGTLGRRGEEGGEEAMGWIVLYERGPQWRGQRRSYRRHTRGQPRGAMLTTGMEKRGGGKAKVEMVPQERPQRRRQKSTPVQGGGGWPKGRRD